MMTNVYPVESKTSDAPPSYDQVVYPQAPPVPNISIFQASPVIHQPQAPPPGTQTYIMVPGMMFGDMPLQCTCPYCHQAIITRIEKNSGAIVWLICGGLILIGCWLGCCLIPFCIDDIKDTEHYCPSCARLLGRRSRM